MLYDGTFDYKLSTMPQEIWLAKNWLLVLLIENVPILILIRFSINKQ